jgi:hypothetical protein
MHADRDDSWRWLWRARLNKRHGLIHLWNTMFQL